MRNRDILAIGASARGIDALICLARQFPVDFPAAVLATAHLGPCSESVLHKIRAMRPAPGPQRATSSGANSP